jgi:PKHD-type hydroxylase
MPGPAFFRLFRLFVRERFLEPELCSRLAAELQDAPGQPATIRTAGSTYVVDPEVRRAGCVFPSDDLAQLVEHRLAALMPELDEHFHVRLRGLQTPQFLVYRAGDFYAAHRDNSPDPEAAAAPRARRISAVVFLNGASGAPAPDNYTGGALTFYGLMNSPGGRSVGLPLAAEAGLLVAFPSDTLHAVAPVTAGQRFTIAAWYY